jgi:FkbM family methyltransferase
VLLRLYRAFKHARITLRPGELRALSRHRDVLPGHLERNSAGRLVLRESEVEVLGANREFLLTGITLLDDLRRWAGATLANNSSGEVVLEVGGVRVLLTCWEELFILHEVFFRTCYQLRMSRPFRLVDVGMNTGTTSLFFAANPLCQRVDAFELFPPTAARAERNFELNSRWRDKIHVTVAGLAEADAELELDYYPEYKGSVGMDGLPDYARPADRVVAAQKVRVQVRGVAAVFAQLLRDANGVPLVCKLDCEGAEYQIVEALKEAGLLGRIPVLMIEWHQLGVAPLESALAGAGFQWFAFNAHGPHHGMIYAWQPAGHPGA